MSNPKHNKPQTSAPIDVPSETLSETRTETPSAALAAPAATPPAPATELDALALAYENNVTSLSEQLEKIAVANPEFGQRLAEVIAYTVARVDGVVGNQQIPIPYIGMRQATTKEDSLPDPDTRIGELYSKQGRLGPKQELIPLLTHRKRVKFSQGSTRPDCSSLDGETGTKYGACKSCPHSQRDESSDTRSACSAGHAFAFVSADFTQLYQVDFMKTNASVGKRLKDLAMRPTGLYSAVFELSTKKEKNKRDEEYHVFSVKAAGRKVEGPEYEAARLLSRYFDMRHKFSVARQGLYEKEDGPIPVGAIGGGETSADAGPDFSAGAL